jgi:colanic acid/amylovoran biosynthesis protein
MANEPVISIAGGTIWGNRGAESMLVATIGQLRTTFPNARFNIFSYYPEKDRQLVEDASITILSGKPFSLATRHFLGALIGSIFLKITGKVPNGNFFRIARALAESDVLLDIGGITFSDGREKFLPFNILSIWPAMMLGVPVVKMAQAVGPFKRPINRLFARLFLFRCDHIFARGEKTSEFLQQLNFPKDKFDTVADIAFLYKPEFSLSIENEDKVNTLIHKLEVAKEQGRKIIVFSPSILVESESRLKGLDYTGRFFDAIKALGQKEYQFVFMPNATREGSQKSHNNDLLTITAMKNAWEVAQVEEQLLADIEWVDYDINTASIRRIISEADVLVTSRYHAMISGLSLGIPMVVIGWGHKYKETLAYFGLERYSFDFGENDAALTGSITEILENHQKITDQIKENQLKVRSLAKIQFDYLDRVLS